MPPMSSRLDYLTGSLNLPELRARLAEVFWLIPALCLVVSGALAVGLIEIDKRLERSAAGFAFTGGPSSAREVLSTVASSMLSFTGLVFSITIVVLQLTSSQFSPRVLRTFMRDRFIQLSLGIFLSTFLYALIALREVRGEDGVVDSFVPGLTISVGFALVLASVATFVRYVSHIAQSIRIVNIVDRIAGETEAAIEHLYPHDATDALLQPPAAASSRVLTSSGRGIVIAIDIGTIIAKAAEHGCVVRILPKLGDFVPRGAPLCEVSGGEGFDEGDICRAVALGPERNLDQDAGFGFRQLVDVAEKALSPGVNDPTTAVQCLDQIHNLLRILATRPYPSGVHADDDGTVRLVVPIATWADHVHAAIDELRHWGSGSLQVQQKLRRMLEDLLAVAPADRRYPLEEQIRLLEARTEDDLPPVERALVRGDAKRGEPRPFPVGPGRLDPAE